MRELVYYIATTLDGFIAREDGSFDDFPWTEAYLAELMALFPETFPAPFRGGDPERADNRRFDAVLMGRKTYEVGSSQGLTNPYPTLDQYVVSSTMSKSPDPAVTLISGGVASKVRTLKEQAGKAIWLCGGSGLAADLFEAGLVDRLVVKLNPIVFGSGIPLLARGFESGSLELEHSRSFESGHVLLEYRVGAKQAETAGSDLR